MDEQLAIIELNRELERLWCEIAQLGEGQGPLIVTVGNRAYFNLQ